MDVETQDISEFSLSERDTNVLQVFEEEGLTSFTFDGLKRRLGLHSETLSRVLCRLEDKEIVEKGLDGYRVTSKVREFLRFPPKSREPSVPVLQTFLSPDVPIHQVVSDLRGKWFGVLRWLGCSENNGYTTLKWITEDGGIQVDANFSNGGLSIETKLLHGKDLNTALHASYQLIGQIAKLYSRPDQIRRVAYFSQYVPNSMSA
jgi:hypothetical protein